MDGNSIFWVTIWRFIITGAAIAVCAFSGCTAHSNYLLGQAIEHGADPIKANCAFSVQPSTVNCALASTQH